ncbi:nitrilase and fragile histidine triad fusion protein NitFhit-like [Diadema antillarum]|uniref:nitrilase and fragile histidine triad fusion protein NitFhit-like n=1 Tax=Diadema antillarum TaxID=105358 RepID=UPI003A8A8894
MINVTRQIHRKLSSNSVRAVTLLSQKRTCGTNAKGTRERIAADMTQSAVIAVCQMTATEDKEGNIAVCRKLVEQASNLGAKMVFLPECSDYVQKSPEESVRSAEPDTGQSMAAFKEIAKENHLWLSLGGLHEKNPEDDSKLLNTHYIVDDNGEVAAKYSKTHLFSLNIKNQVQLQESQFVKSGTKIVPPVQTPVGKIGMGICYDIRFPEFSLTLAKQGAEILTYPSAFTVPTGMAHWEPLLRCRAIETQCYVVAAAQTGKHNDWRASYGHAMIVDPWGAIVAQCSEGESVAVAAIDLAYLQRVRTSMPIWDHRRTDLYPVF